MANVYDILVERGFVKDCSDERGLRTALEKPITLYVGYDPTASSLHVGNLLTIMALAWMQRHGHRPIALVGGGTGLVGDPTGRATGRSILTYEQIEENLQGQKVQLQRYLDFSEGRALMINNAEWLTKLNYLEFLRDVGVYFSVNQMLSMETYKTKLESEAGLNFLEFNYALLQAYDFLTLYRRHGCVLQMGGSDQWANSLAGADLIRRIEGGHAYVLVTPLLTTSSGAKMGKSQSGSVWLDAGRYSPYDYYQFWINTEDPDVERFLALYTFLPMEQVRELGRLEGADIRWAKDLLAFEATKITHGEEAAQVALQSSRDLFRSVVVSPPAAATTASAMPPTIVTGEATIRVHASLTGTGSVTPAIPTTRLSTSEFGKGILASQLFASAGLASSRGEARRLIQQGGAYVNGRRVEAVDEVVTPADLEDGALFLRAGKKKYHRVVVE